MANNRKLPGIIEAVRFDPPSHPWPERVKPWPIITPPSPVISQPLASAPSADRFSARAVCSPALCGSMRRASLLPAGKATRSSGELVARRGPIYGWAFLFCGGTGLLQEQASGDRSRIDYGRPTSRHKDGLGKSAPSRKQPGCIHPCYFSRKHRTMRSLLYILSRYPLRVFCFR
jgi:hypothetical protein